MNPKKTFSGSILFGIIVFFLFSIFPAIAAGAFYYVCNDGATCNSGNGTGWSTGDDDNTCISKSAPCRTISAAFTQMSAGDTLIIGDGTYTGELNRIEHTSRSSSRNQTPPNGTPDNYTRVQAENNGQVTFDGEGERFMFYLVYGNHEYLEFEGLKWINPDHDHGSGSLAAVELAGCSDNGCNSSLNHIKFFRCGAKAEGFTSETMSWNIRAGHYLLFEECYAWGQGSYGFMVQNLYKQEYNPKKIILRRCVVRPDDVNGVNQPTSGFMVYGSSEVEFQNNIVIDADTSTYNNVSYIGGAFTVRRKDSYGPSDDIHFRGNIALNNLGWRWSDASDGRYYYAGHSIQSEGPRENTVENSVLWDVMHAVRHAGDPSQGSPVFTKSTIKTVNDPNGTAGRYGAYGIRLDDAWTVKNTIIINHQEYCIRDARLDIGGPTEDYNLIYTDASDYLDTHVTPGIHSYSDDPANNPEFNPEVDYDTQPRCLKYIVRIEEGSRCDGTGENGADIGATVIKRYGRSGSLWGEPGYNLLQDGTNGQADEDLWPFPYEDQMKADFATYNPGGTDPGKPDGERGFADPDDKQLNEEDDVTLTSYIWEYLGNQMPCEIYNTCGDTRPLPAFPGAEGFGSDTVGGRGGAVIYVTNLNDSGPGSLRAALGTPGPRIVVFKVSGYIELQSQLQIRHPFLTLAGETSPGGICVVGEQVTLRTHDVIIRHMRFRMGQTGPEDDPNDRNERDSFDIWGNQQKDGADNDAFNIIVDHCSFSWGVDETFTCTYAAHDFTISNCMVYEGLRTDAAHSKGLLFSQKFGGVTRVSAHHNYIASSYDRNPMISGISESPGFVDWRNNVTYNYYGANSIILQADGIGNFVHNFTKAGPDSNPASGAWPIARIDEQEYNAVGGIYVEGNLGNQRTSQSDPEWCVSDYFRPNLIDAKFQKATPHLIPAEYVVTTTPMDWDYSGTGESQLANQILADVGATKPFRDSADRAIICDFHNGTGSIPYWKSYPGDYPVLPSPPPPADTDIDGMADEWERARGLLIGVNDSAGDDDSDGYTNIEEYLHFLAGGQPPDTTGDINGDCVVNLTDGVLALQVASGLEPGGITLNGETNNDGRIGIAEAIMILRKLGGSPQE